MKFIAMVDKYLENPYKVSDDTRRNAHYPSQSSCVIKNEYGEEIVVGSCLRSLFWSHKGVKETNPMTARGHRICAVGKMVERAEVEQYKQLGIWRGNNIKFFDSEMGISGEIDCFVWNEQDKRIQGIEIKSGYDYRFRSEVIGTASRSGKPKLEHLMQTMIYIHHFKFPFSILYFDRGNAARAEYEITLNSDGTPNIDGKKLNIGLSIPRCFSRFKELEGYVKDNTLPKRDFQLKYSKERIKFLRDSGRLTKEQSREFDATGETSAGDWNCAYCNFRDFCYKTEEK
jgi:hypothetical protein